MINWKGCGRKWKWPNRFNIPTFSRNDLGKQLKVSVRIAGVLAEIRTEHLPKTNLQRHHCTNRFSPLLYHSMYKLKEKIKKAVPLPSRGST
jgi:hypothetical protein